MDSERQRVLLARVCKSWKRFASDNKFRWIQYDTTATIKGLERDEAELMDALRYASLNPVLDDIRGEDGNSSRWCTRRMVFDFEGTDVRPLYRQAMKMFSNNLIILFVDCDEAYASSISESLLAQDDPLPNLRCLQLPNVDFTKTPLQRISRAFPKLTGLTLLKGVLPHNPADSLSLPKLESLRLAGFRIAGMNTASWELPALIRLLVPVYDDLSEDLFCGMLHHLGKKLILLHVDARRWGLQLPKDFWNRCPQLVELEIPLQCVKIDTSIPSGHPLKYLVLTERNSGATRSEHKRTLAQSICACGDKIQVVILGEITWGDYLKHMDEHTADGPPTAEQEAGDYLLPIAQRLLGQGTRLEDSTGRTREESLVDAPIPEECR